jgi:hypothetical protein
MDDTSLVVDMLLAGEIFFFAGSGISYASNLPSAYAVLERTANIFLPTSVSEDKKKDICKRIQPEVFYESIIGMTRTYECLDIWRSLYKDEQDKHHVQCRPNFTHLFIAEYSRKNSLPIVTTNFDSMFEQACDLIGIKSHIVLPTDSPHTISGDDVLICKVHGSIQDNNGEYSPHALWTTMTQITKVNTEWIEYINTLMSNKHICFVGYSGRDIDLFPYIAEFPKKSWAKRIVWINDFAKDPASNTASISCNALRVEKWPIDFFNDISIRIDIGKPVQKEQQIPISEKIEILLASLEQSLSEKKLLTNEEKELLYCVLLAKLGHYREAHQFATELKKTKLPHFSRLTSKNHLLLTCARLSHEISRYESCRKYASQVLTMSKNKEGYDVNAVLQASCLVSEAYRMSIPSDIYFSNKKKLIDYLYVFFVLAHFILTSFATKLRMLCHRLYFSDLSTGTQHELIEHRIRFYALVQSILGSPQRGWNRFIKAFLSRIWVSIRDTSYRVGYSAGIANAGKFKYRLTPSDKTKSESANIYTLTTSATGAELLIRNEGDQLLRDGQFAQSRTKFIEYIEMAKKSGNTLNEIKGIIGYAYANHMEGKMPLLTDVMTKRFVSLTGQVEGRRWRNHFSYITTILCAETNNT